MSCTTPSWQCAVRDDHHPALLSHPAHRCTTRPLHAKLEGAPLPSVLRPPPAVPQLEAAARTTLATPFNGGVHSTDGAHPSARGPVFGRWPARATLCLGRSQRLANPGFLALPEPRPGRNLQPGSLRETTCPSFRGPSFGRRPARGTIRLRQTANCSQSEDLRTTSDRPVERRRSRVLSRDTLPLGPWPQLRLVAREGQLAPQKTPNSCHAGTPRTPTSPPTPPRGPRVLAQGTLSSVSRTRRNSGTRRGICSPPSHGNPADAGAWPRAPDGTPPRGSTAGPLANGAPSTPGRPVQVA